MDGYIEWLFFFKVTRQFRMYTYRIRGKRGRFKIILPLLFVPSWRYQACPVLRHYFQITYIFIRSWTGMFMRISIGNLIITGGIRLMKEYCQVLFIFFFSGRLCRNRYCTFLDFQNRFDKVCRIVFRFVPRPLADSFRRNLLQNGNASAFPDFSVSFKTWNPVHIRICHITLQFVPV